MKEGTQVEVVACEVVSIAARFIGMRGTIIVDNEGFTALGFVRVSVPSENRVYSLPEVNVRVLDAIELLGEVTE